MEKPLRAGQLGLARATAAQVSRLPLPPLTEERRNQYVKLVRQKAEEARVAIRNVRRDEIHRIDQMTKKGEVAEDESKRAQTRLQKLVDGQIERVDALATRKEHEVLEI